MSLLYKRYVSGAENTDFGEVVAFFGVRDTAAELSVDSLKALNCLYRNASNIMIAAYGREIMIACADKPPAVINEPAAGRPFR
jgi:hypothetical protein